MKKDKTLQDAQNATQDAQNATQGAQDAQNNTALSTVSASTTAIAKGIDSGNYDSLKGVNLSAMLKGIDSIQDDTLKALTADLCNSAAAVSQNTDLSTRNFCIALARVQMQIETGKSGYADFKEYVGAIHAGDYSTLTKYARAGYVYLSDKFPQALKSFSWSKLDAINATIADVEQLPILLEYCKDGRITSATTQKELRDIAANIKITAAQNATQDAQNATQGAQDAQNATQGAQDAQNATQGAQDAQNATQKPQVKRYGLFKGGKPCQLSVRQDEKTDVLVRSATLEQYQKYFKAQKNAVRIKPAQTDDFLDRYVVVDGINATVYTIDKPVQTVNTDAVSVREKMLAAGLEKTMVDQSIAAMYGADWANKTVEYVDF